MFAHESVNPHPSLFARLLFGERGNGIVNPARQVAVDRKDMRK
jgi:hypothetical protein